MPITGHFIILLQAAILITMCNGRPCHKFYSANPTIYPGFSASQTYLGTPNYAYQPYMHSQSFNPAYPAYHAYPAYSAPVAPSGPAVMQTNPYVILQQPTQVHQTNNGPYGVSLFKETVPSTSKVQNPQRFLSRNTPQSPSFLPPLAEISLPQKRETPEKIKENPDKIPVKVQPKELQFPPELYVPEDEFLHPSLHRFPHDLFPYAEIQSDDNSLDKHKSRRQSHNDEFTNCTFGHSCSDCDKEKYSKNNQENFQTHNDPNLRSFKDLDPNNHNQEEEYSSGMRIKVKPGFTLDDFNSEMKSSFKNQNELHPGSSTELSNNDKRYYIQTDNIHTQSFESDLNQSNSKRDTYSTLNDSLSPTDLTPANSTENINDQHHDVICGTEPSLEVESVGGCKCLQQLKKCVHNAKNIAEYLVKKACDVIGKVDEDEV